MTAAPPSPPGRDDAYPPAAPPGPDDSAPSPPPPGQLTFTSITPAPGRSGGWQIKQAENLSVGQQRVLVERISFSFGNLAGNDPRNARRLAFEALGAGRAVSPTGRNLPTSRAGGHQDAALWHTAPAGQDPSGRPGNVFAHILVFRDPPPGPARPADWWHSADWLRPWGAAEVDRAMLGPAPRPWAGDALQASAAFLVESGWARRRLFPVLVDSVLGALGGGPAVVMIVDQPDEAAHWVAAVSHFLPPALAWRLGFSTDETAQTIGRALLSGRFPLIGLPRLEAEAALAAGGLRRAVVFDEVGLTNGRLTLTDVPAERQDRTDREVGPTDPRLARTDVPAERQDRTDRAIGSTDGRITPSGATGSAPGAARATRLESPSGSVTVPWTEWHDFADSLIGRPASAVADLLGVADQLAVELAQRLPDNTVPTQWPLALALASSPDSQPDPALGLADDMVGRQTPAILHEVARQGRLPLVAERLAAFQARQGPLAQLRRVADQAAQAAQAAPLTEADKITRLADGLKWLDALAQAGPASDPDLPAATATTQTLLQAVGAVELLSHEGASGDLVTGRPLSPATAHLLRQALIPLADDWALGDWGGPKGNETRRWLSLAATTWLLAGEEPRDPGAGSDQTGDIGPGGTGAVPRHTGGWPGPEGGAPGQADSVPGEAGHARGALIALGAAGDGRRPSDEGGSPAGDENTPPPPIRPDEAGDLVERQWLFLTAWNHYSVADRTGRPGAGPTAPWRTAIAVLGATADTASAFDLIEPVVRRADCSPDQLARLVVTFHLAETGGLLPAGPLEDAFRRRPSGPDLERLAAAVERDLPAEDHALRGLSQLIWLRRHSPQPRRGDQPDDIGACQRWCSLYCQTFEEPLGESGAAHVAADDVVADAQVCVAYLALAERGSEWRDDHGHVYRSFGGWLPHVAGRSLRGALASQVAERLAEAFPPETILAGVVATDLTSSTDRYRAGDPLTAGRRQWENALETTQKDMAALNQATRYRLDDNGQPTSLFAAVAGLQAAGRNHAPTAEAVVREVERVLGSGRPLDRERPAVEYVVAAVRGIGLDLNREPAPVATQGFRSAAPPVADAAATDWEVSPGQPAFQDPAVARRAIPEETAATPAPEWDSVDYRAQDDGGPASARSAVVVAAAPPPFGPPTEVTGPSGSTRPVAGPVLGTPSPPPASGSGSWPQPPGLSNGGQVTGQSRSLMEAIRALRRWLVVSAVVVAVLVGAVLAFLLGAIPGVHPFHVSPAGAIMLMLLTAVVAVLWAVSWVFTWRYWSQWHRRLPEGQAGLDRLGPTLAEPSGNAGAPVAKPGKQASGAPGNGPPPTQYSGQGGYP